MAYLKTSTLPMDKNIEIGSDRTCIHNISDYIGRIKRYIYARRDREYFSVYRGEPCIYPTPCRPGLFRSDALTENKYFEKNLFDAMRQSRLTDEKCYLDNAIDAQHGEFPSRLLDVSYNCLIALYFAVTPYYHKKEEELDGEDGMVFVFFMDEIFSPSAQNINDNYNAIINRDREWTQSPLFRKNHKFIDHIKLGPRIIAQQGAFILFQGDVAEDLPQGMYYGIRIPGGAKKLLREQLNRLFGIHTGSIYPETINLVKDLTRKSGWINTQPYSCENELHYTLRQMERELDYYLYYVVSRKMEQDRKSEADRENGEQLQNILGMWRALLTAIGRGSFILCRIVICVRKIRLKNSGCRLCFLTTTGSCRRLLNAWRPMAAEGLPGKY